MYAAPEWWDFTGTEAVTAGFEGQGGDWYAQEFPFVQAPATTFMNDPSSCSLYLDGTWADNETYIFADSIPASSRQATTLQEYDGALPRALIVPHDVDFEGSEDVSIPDAEGSGLSSTQSAIESSSIRQQVAGPKCRLFSVEHIGGERGHDESKQYLVTLWLPERDLAREKIDEYERKKWKAFLSREKAARKRSSKGTKPHGIASRRSKIVQASI